MIRQRTTIAVVRSGSLHTQQHVTTLCNFLVRDCNVHFISLGSIEGERPAGFVDQIKFTQIYWKQGKNIQGVLSRLSAANRLKKVLHGLSVDLLYIIDSWSLSFFWLATHGTFRLYGVPLVYHTFDMLEPGLDEWFYLYLEKIVCNSADLVVNTDKIRARYMKSVYRLRESPLYVRNTYPRNISLPKRNEELRRTMLGDNPPPDALLLAYPTIAGSERLTLELIEAFSLLPTRYRLFTIAGDDQYANKCRSVIKKKNLGDRVVMHSAVSHSRIVEFVACADMGAIFHNYESSFGNYLANPGRLPLFISLGIPFVAADVPTLEADVYRYGLGVCCNPFVPEEIAAALRTLAEGAPGLEARSAALRALFHQEFHYEKTAASLDKALKIMIGNTKRVLL